MKKIALDFMICPDELIKKCYVPNPVRIRIIDACFITVKFGDSGHKMIKGGCEFYVAKALAKAWVEMGVAEKVGA